jgi:hypothetical protein
MTKQTYTVSYRNRHGHLVTTKHATQAASDNRVAKIQSSDEWGPDSLMWLMKESYEDEAEQEDAA